MKFFDDSDITSESHVTHRDLYKALRLLAEFTGRCHDYGEDVTIPTLIPEAVLKEAVALQDKYSVSGGKPVVS